MYPRSIAAVFVGLLSLELAASASGQLVCLPAPRLLTIMPLGGQAGASFEVVIAGENLGAPVELLFSTPKITATPKTAADGKAEANKFIVTIAADAPRGVHEARAMSRLGVSSSRAFSVGDLPERTRDKPNLSLETALELKPNSICNAAATKRAVDFYAFQAARGEHLVVDLAAAGIDSKLTAVLIIADAQGRDLLVDRRGGILDFTAPADGKYFIKAHDLTFQGGPEYFYRLALLDAPGPEPAPRQPTTSAVSSFSWRPENAANIPRISETEPNDQSTQAQRISPPCDVAGRFYPAADADTFEFTAGKGETWWVEVVSERLGWPTDPFVLAQRVVKQGADEQLVDVAEFNDIPSPIKPSSNGYSYDGPPYDAGSADVLGKLEIKEDGLYRLQVRDLFGGTRSEPRHAYRLIVRKATPDFALVAWALHMNLRNGDRNALSKPLALRGGSTMALEVAVVRRDGFDGEIELGVDDLPSGVTACGLTIPAGNSRGLLLVSAAEEAPRSLASVKLFGRARIDGAAAVRPCRLASMAWPVRDASQEIPKPRMLADAPLSVAGAERAPVTIAPSENKIWEAKAGEKLAVPLKLVWRSEFAGGSIKLKTLGAGFEKAPELEIPLQASDAELILDLLALKTPPGEYALALCGAAVTKHRDQPDAAPKEIVDIVVSEPIRILVLPEAKK